jgi:hypothetical protein
MRFVVGPTQIAELFTNKVFPKYKPPEVNDAPDAVIFCGPICKPAETVVDDNCKYKSSTLSCNLFVPSSKTMNGFVTETVP